MLGGRGVVPFRPRLGRSELYLKHIDQLPGLLMRNYASQYFYGEELKGPVLLQLGGPFFGGPPAALLLQCQGCPASSSVASGCELDRDFPLTSFLGVPER